MRKPRRKNPLVAALYVNAALLLAILVAMVSGGRVPSVLPEAFAAPLSPQPIAGGGGLYLMPAQFSINSWGCYVMDVDAQTLLAYEFKPGQSKLRLVSARGIRHDRRLQRFNIDKPSPEEVAKLVELEQAGKRGDGAEDDKPEPEPEPEADGEQ
jgi:hypothetical protein